MVVGLVDVAVSSLVNYLAFPVNGSPVWYWLSTRLGSWIAIWTSWKSGFPMHCGKLREDVRDYEFSVLIVNNTKAKADFSVGPSCLQMHDRLC